MKLPEIAITGTPSAPTGELERLAGAQQRLGSVIEQGLTAYSQELVRTQQQEAAVKVAEGLNQVELGLKAKKYVTAQDIRDTFGDAIPPHLRDQLQTKDPTTGELVDNQQIPTWAVGDAVYAKAAEKLVDSAAQGISGVGWQTDFRDQMAKHIVARKMQVAEYHLHALDQYLQETQTQQVQRLTNAGDFGGAREIIAGSTAFAPEVKQKLHAQVEAAAQERPALDALMADDPAVIKAQADRLRSDPAAMAAIPEDRRKTLIVHLDDRYQKFESTRIANVAFSAGFAPGSRVLDEGKVFAAVKAQVDGKPPELQKLARDLTKARIADWKEERKAQTSEIAGTALQQFMAPGKDGKPRLSTAFIDSQVRAYLTDPASGKEAADAWEQLVRWEASNEAHQRNLRQMPTDEEEARAFLIERSIALRPGDWRDMNGADQMAVMAGTKPVPGEPAAPTVAISAKDVPALSKKIADISAPPTTAEISQSGRIVHEELLDAFPSLKDKKPVANARAAVNEVTDRLSRYVNAEQRRTGKKPPEDEQRQFVRKQLDTAPIRDRFLGIPLPTTTDTPVLKLQLEGTPYTDPTTGRTFTPPSPEMRRALKPGEVIVYDPDGKPFAAPKEKLKDLPAGYTVEGQ